MKEIKNRCHNYYLDMRIKIVLFSCLLIFVSSCASIPKETAEMSILLEHQISILKQANNNFITTLYKEKEDNFVKYLDNVWYPQHIQATFSDSIIIKAWNEAVETDSLQDRMRLIQSITMLCQNEYKQRKDAGLKSIHTVRDSIIGTFNQQYDLSLRMNSIILKNTKSASDLQDNYRSFIDKILPIEKLDSITSSSLNKIDTKLNKIKNGILEIEEIGGEINSLTNKND